MHVDAPYSENIPAGHGLQLDAEMPPLLFEYVPALQDIQDDAPIVVKPSHTDPIPHNASHGAFIQDPRGQYGSFQSTI